MKTTNIKIIGKPLFHATLKDIAPLVTFYTLPWAYDPDTKELDLNFPADFIKGGTMELPVKKLLDGRYEIDFRNIDYTYYRKK